MCLDPLLPHHAASAGSSQRLRASGLRRRRGRGGPRTASSEVEGAVGRRKLSMSGLGGAPYGLMMAFMAINALAMDDENNVHMLIGLNRSDVDSLLRGDYFHLAPGAMPLNESRDCYCLRRDG